MKHFRVHKEKLKSERYEGFDIVFYVNGRSGKQRRVTALIDEDVGNGDKYRYIKVERVGNTKDEAFEEMKRVIDSIKHYHDGDMGAYIYAEHEANEEDKALERYFEKTGLKDEED